MDSLIAIVAGIAILDGWSDLPIYLAPLLVALSGARPVRTTVMYMAGIVITYMGMGFVALAALHELDEFLDRLNARLWAFWHDPSFLEVCLQLVIGVVLIVLARRMVRGGAEEDDVAVPATLTPRRALVVGGGLALAGIPAAAPYFAAIAQILRAQLGPAPALNLVVLYNVLYLSPVLCLLAVRLLFAERSAQLFERIGGFIDAWARRLLIAGMALLGAFLVLDGILWFFGESMLPY